VGFCGAPASIPVPERKKLLTPAAARLTGCPREVDVCASEKQLRAVRAAPDNADDPNSTPSTACEEGTVLPAADCLRGPSLRIRAMISPMSQIHNRAER